MKKYPRIYSLGAINIIHHQEFDYKFHPFRTDFTGESGVGKSIITDLIQLILIGSTKYQSSTQGQDDRPYTSLIIETPDKGEYGYAYLNVEVAKEKFVLVGCYIERRSKKTQAFIVQKSLDFEQDMLTPFDQPITVATFEKDNKWLTLPEFNRHINTSDNLGCKIFNLFKDYHEVLYKSKILPIDLFSNNGDLEDYAKILQAFARRGINVKNDVDLQEFLHGKHTGTKFYYQFREAEKQMEDSITSHRKNHQEYLDIKEKNALLKKLRDLKVVKDNTAIKFHNVEYNFKTNRLKELNRNIKQALNNYFIAKESINALNKLKETTLLECDSKLTEVTIQEKPLKIGSDNLQITIDFINHVDNALEKLTLKNETELKTVYLKYIENKDQISRYQEIKNQLQLQGLEDDFNTLDHQKTFKEIVDTLNKEILDNTAQIKQYKELINFNDYENPKSMAYWVLNQKRNFNIREESILRYFFDVETSRPEEINSDSKYLPDPNEILKTLKDEGGNSDEAGFWIDLSGLQIFIERKKPPIFNTANIDELKEIFQSNNRNLSLKLKEKEKALKIQKHLCDFLLKHLREPEIDLKVWHNRNNLQQEVELGKEVFLSFEGFNFNIEIEKYAKKESVLLMFARKEKELNDVRKKIRQYENLQENLSVFETKSIQGNKTRIVEIAKEEKIEIEPIANISVDNNKFIIDFTEKYRKANDNLKAVNEIEEVIRKRDAYKTELETLELRYPYVKEVDLVEKLSDEDYNNSYEIYNKANRNYWEELKAILIAYKLTDKEEQLKGDQSFVQLAKLLFPSEIFKSISFNEVAILDGIENYLEKIIEINAKINQNKLIAIKDILDALKVEVSNQIEINKSIKRFFKEDYTRITGDNNASLMIKQSTTVSLQWIGEYLKKLATVDIGLFDYQESLNAKNEKLPSLEDKLLYAYQEFSKTPEPNISLRRLLNPFSYYELDYSIVTKSGKRNSGSTGQTYTSIALLCIAKLSLKNESYTNTKLIPGLRFMGIDEAEGIGSNFDMLSKIAERFDYQIISLSISPNKLKKENQYVYRLTKIADEERANHHPSVIFT
ncbi:hypothetical protein [Winogradskyella sp.]|jgi:hypothetical protein|uniref:hypothetical protein n=1 Tax=Winogradskyella sp. TaxID=1883156 RepID=UPI0025D0A630|nr:hypothetical protein [Winogradskyella sp.]MCT4629604.1 hypothetical protein [Winogradskyella sp.]